jgi:hypothetical protein
MTDGQLTLTSQKLKTPRAAAIAGIPFAVLFGSTIWVRPGVMPRWLALLTYALALVLLVSIGSNLWVTLIFPGWVCIISLYILALNLRSPSMSPQGGELLNRQGMVERRM